MTMTDPIADFLTRLRNANSAYHDEVTLPHSKIKANIAEILKSEGYINDFHTEDARVGKSLVVQLKYGPSRERSIAGLRRVSKPGLRVYARSSRSSGSGEEQQCRVLESSRSQFRPEST
jgi:small subunit ribosomal protein S8